jgi:hypothetical protein
MLRSESVAIVFREIRVVPVPVSGLLPERPWGMGKSLWDTNETRLQSERRQSGCLWTSVAPWTWPPGLPSETGHGRH